MERFDRSSYALEGIGRVLIGKEGLSFGAVGGFTRLFAHPWTGEGGYTENSQRTLKAFHQLNDTMQELAREACFKEFVVCTATEGL